MLALILYKTCMMKLFLYASLSFSVCGMAQAQDIRVAHCLHGVCPSGAGEGNTLAVHELYVLSNNPETKLADWVAYRPTRETAATSVDLNRGWKADPLLAPETTFEPRGVKGGDDYKGASQLHGYERGHLVPLTLFADVPYWRTTNYLSNVAPMQSALNRGPWAKLELQEKEASYESRSLYVLTGPLYGAPVDCTPSTRDVSCLPNADEDHAVPIAYWKVVMSKTGKQASAFIMPQTASRKGSHCDYLSTLEAVEEHAGIALLPSTESLPDRHLHKELGCEPPYTVSLSTGVILDSANDL